MMKIRENLKRKLNSKKGFTLAEMLLAVLILLMVSAVVAAGIPAAREAYEKVVLTSNAEVMLATTVSTLRNELGSAKHIEPTSNASNDVVYYSLTRGAPSRIFKAADGNNQIMFYRYYSDTEIGSVGDATAVPLMQSKDITGDLNLGDLYVTYTNVSCSGEIITFTGLSVNRKSDKRVMTSIDSLSIRAISEDEDS